MDEIFHGWKVHAQYSLTILGYDIMFYRDRGDTREFLQPPDAHGNYIVQSVSEGRYVEGIRPTFRIDDFTVKELIAAVQEAGVKPKDITKTEGLLQAQTEHLKDLQKVLRKQGIMK